VSIPTLLRAGSVTLMLVVPALWPCNTAAQTASAPVFKTGVDRVTLFATVRDRRGRVVTDLTRVDFELLDAGERRSIVEFRAGRARVSLALVMDVSGSMAIGSKAARARLVVKEVLASLEPDKDEVAMYAFDTELREVQPFSTATDRLPGTYEGTEAFGATSLWDAAASAARQVAERGSRRRALVVLTDGVDTNSRWTARDVSGLASAFDVPVYIVAVEPPLNDTIMQNLSDLARWTGGNMHVVTGTVDASVEASAIVNELRHQYFMAFETSVTPGWHPLVIRTRNRSLDIRARSGYFVAPQTLNN
jgi:Ca-activated chloride channel family protein